MASALIKYTPEASGKDSRALTAINVCVFQFFFAVLEEKSSEVLQESKRVRERQITKRERKFLALKHTAVSHITVS